MSVKCSANINIKNHSPNYAIPLDIYSMERVGRDETRDET